MLFPHVGGPAETSVVSANVGLGRERGVAVAEGVGNVDAVEAVNLGLGGGGAVAAAELALRDGEKEREN